MPKVWAEKSIKVNKTFFTSEPHTFEHSIYLLQSL